MIERENQMEVYVLFADESYGQHAMIGVYESLIAAIEATRVYLESHEEPLWGFFAEPRILGGAASDAPRPANPNIIRI